MYERKQPKKFRRHFIFLNYFIYIETQKLQNFTKISDVEDNLSIIRCM